MNRYLADYLKDIVDYCEIVTYTIVTKRSELMKSKLVFRDSKTHLVSDCNSHFNISLNSEKLLWESIYLEKGTAAFFKTKDVYVEEFVFAIELSNAFDWETSSQNNTRQISTSVGSIWINAPHQVFSHDNQHFSEFLVLSIEPKTMFEFYDQTIPFNQLKFISNFSVEDQALEMMIKLFYQEAITNNQNGCNYINHLLSVLSNYFINNYSNISEIISGESHSSFLTLNQLQEIDQLILSKLSSGVVIDDLAVFLKLDKYNLITEFKKLTGITPYQHIINLRIAKAKQLLMTTDVSLVSIALDTGFNDSSHFSRTFKKHTGLTPLKFRKSIELSQKQTF